jgi:hypothetical protein
MPTSFFLLPKTNLTYEKNLYLVTSIIMPNPVLVKLISQATISKDTKL